MTRGCFDVTGFVNHWHRHVSLVTIVQYKLKDQSLKHFKVIFRVIARFGVVKPMPVNDKNVGKVAE